MPESGEHDEDRLETENRADAAAARLPRHVNDNPVDRPISRYHA
jgi:hypothetical protein